MLIAKNEEMGFDELTNQLCMFERNFAKSETNHKNARETLAATNQDKQKHNSKGTFQKQSRKGDTCSYCYKRGHWVKDHLCSFMPPASNSCLCKNILAFTITGPNKPNGSNSLDISDSTVRFLHFDVVTEVIPANPKVSFFGFHLRPNVLIFSISLSKQNSKFVLRSVTYC
ncbi:hypothetical protein AVEN_131553-1 [Araneus ventricosus]|uniref:Uncharacterized protein n=1 Tax=Araneus ventricosus TaxID=182803 RepID=A0A4Y2HVG2_ARAVE|nr:hypothetical protein AVEN_131553-1 [Araneus ventricosus]